MTMRIIDDIKMPGVSFETVPPALAETLPPMDIAAFVGFAASGPLDTPVAVEDVVRFQEIFGDDLPLAWDAGRNAWQYAHLAPVVRGFFRNGGQRCWIVRVAEPVQPAQFELPFLLAHSKDHFYSARAKARSQGTWADTLQLNTAMQRTLLIDAAIATEDENVQIVLGHVAKSSVQPGELLLLEFPELASQLFVKTTDIISRTTRREDNSIDLSSGEQIPSDSYIGVNSTNAFYFKLTTPIDSLETYFARSLDRNSPTIFTVRDPDELEGNIVSPVTEADETRSKSFRIAIEIQHGQKTPAPGTILELIHYSDKTCYLLPIIKTEMFQTSSLSSSPETTNIAILSISNCSHVLDYEDFYADVFDVSSPPSSPIISRVTFEIQVSKDEELLMRLADIGFCPSYKRYWGNLPSDEILYHLPQYGDPRQKLDQAESSLVAEAAHPRFPIACPNEKDDDIDVYLPIGMPFRTLDTARKGVIDDISAANRLSRNGLSTFEADLFLDERLCDKTSAALTSEFFQRRYILKQKIKGLYSLYEIEEVSIIAIPDAVHRPWRLKSIEQDFLTSPQLVSVTMEANTVRLEWEMMNFLEWNISEFQWQQSQDPTFEQAQTFSAGKNLAAEKEMTIGCPVEWWFRVRALRQAEKGPWSNSMRCVIPEPSFYACRQIIRSAPELDPLEFRNNHVILTWNSVEHAIAYQLQRSPLPGAAAFESPVTIYQGEDTQYHEYFPGNQILWFRVRALYENNTPGPWSHTLRTGSQINVIEVLYDEHDYHDEAFFDYQNVRLLAIHRAMFRFCYARADMFAVLSLPSFYRVDDALTYKSNLIPDGSAGVSLKNLQAGVVPLSFGEIRAASYGALVHPWLIAQNESLQSLPGDISLRFTPPDGTVCGHLARVARQEGAWIAPAFMPAEGALSLTPILDPSRRAALFGAQINIFALEVEGFMLQSAFTLDSEREFYQINVRRLLILLRRIALREGNESVFQPNDPGFRREMQRRFDNILNTLFLRGAFAGARPEQAYQVVADDSINTPQSIDAGRFIMELRVAPSQPLMFITVRLVQSSEGLVTEEITTE